MTMLRLVWVLAVAACTGGSGAAVIPADAGATLGKNATDGPWVRPADHRYCPGWMPPPAGVITCLQQSDCPASDPAGPNSLFCLSSLTPQSRSCGGARPQPQCYSDLDCPPGRICRVDPCDRSTCEPGCSLDQCGPTATCVEGRCVLRRCDEPGAASCRQHWSCRPGPDSLPWGCVPDSCRDGYRCSPPRDCNPGGMNADEHGCALRACKHSDDCACGSCVTGFCLEMPGNCGIISFPP
jgi:hypothetical protein